MYRSKLSNYKIRKILKYFCVDLTAVQCSKVSSFNRNTINRYYTIFRIGILELAALEYKKEVGVLD